MTLPRGLDTIERAIADIAAGKAVVVVDDEDRENEGDVVFAAQMASPELIASMVATGVDMFLTYYRRKS